jgi:hypothetical protein
VDPDPDPGGQKLPTKVENFLKVHVLSVGWPLLRYEGFFCNLDVLYGGLGTGLALKNPPKKPKKTT